MIPLQGAGDPLIHPSLFAAIIRTRWFPSRGLVCLMAAALAILPEWSAIWYRYGPTGAATLLGFTWRVLLLGLIPVAAYLILEVVMVSALSFLLPTGWADRTQRAFRSRPAHVLSHGLLFGGIASVIWVLVLSSWKDFDFPFHMPWIEWEAHFRSLAAEVPQVTLGATLVGAGVGWIRSRPRASHPLEPPLATASLWLLMGGVLALDVARRPLGFFGAFAPVTRPLAFLAFVVGLSIWFHRRGTPIPRAVGVMGWMGVIGGAVAGGGLLVTRLAAPGPAVLALVDANRSAASKVWVRLAGSSGSPIELTCPVEAVQAQEDGPARDVILITVDALDPRHLSSYGYPEDTAPAIASLAAQGVQFSQAFSTSSSTRFAIPALAFSRPYECLGPAAGQLPGLFDVLLGAGYTTGLVSGYRFDEGVTQEYSSTLLRPFQHVDFSAAGSYITDTYPVDQDVAARAIEFLRESDPARPMGLWIHFYDPHSVYNPTHEQAARFGSGRTARYDAEVHGTDLAIGRVLQELRTTRPGRESIVVVTADHGESLTEVGARAHGNTMVHPVLQVPLVMVGGGMSESEVDQPVSVLDVAPTVLALAGLGSPASFMGRSLLPLIRGDTQNWGPVRIARPADDGVGSVDERVFHRGYKLVHKLRPRHAILYGTPDIFELYRPAADPAERRNLIGEQPRIAESLKPHLPYRVWQGDRHSPDPDGGS